MDKAANSKNTESENTLNRDQVIVRTSIVGIVTNVMLSIFKALVGLATNSIAITLDAVNNLSDALSSIITIIGAKVAGKVPDKNHPFGHGRAEYLSALIVSAIVLYAGITAAIESVKKIIHPEKASYTAVSLLIVAVAIVVKLVLGKYVKAQGEKVNSASLVASGSDASFDAILSASVLASALIYIATGVSLEAYVGLVIAIFIIKAGVEMVTETLTVILGARADKELTDRVKHILTQEPEVRGAYDLIINDYGPDKFYASVHLELPDTMTVREVDALTRRVERKVYRETGVILVGVGVYSYNTGEGEAARIQNQVCETVMAHDWALQFHGFYLDEENKDLRFDVVMDFDVDQKEGIKILRDELQPMYPDYHIYIAPDVDVSVT